MTSHTGGAVVISEVDDTGQWTWVRHYGVTVFKPQPNGVFTDETIDTIHSVGSWMTYPDSASAMKHAKAVCADLTDPDAFVIE